MADLALDQLTEGKPVLIEKDGKSICVARVGNEVLLKLFNLGAFTNPATMNDF